MKRFQNIIFAALIAIVGGFISVFVYSTYFNNSKVVVVEKPKPVSFVSNVQSGLPDLTNAAENSVKAVVHIQTQFREERYQTGNPFLDFFYGDQFNNRQPQIQQASGSGVIISEDGYIVTNNHVIDHSDKITVILNDNREFKAKLVGKDPDTDIALLKIDATELPSISWGNSDELRLGEWVLAVGNPFNLTSTVTAGIVSAKARGIGIISGRLPIESFIQTDAAVNPGNSGGALVNTRGELVGINTAIASQNGSYSGYSFAIPVSIVKKVVSDIKTFGEVQRALLGVSIQNVNQDIAEKYNKNKIEGVYIGAVTDDGAAKESGIKGNDIIISIDNIKVNTSSELQEQISKHRPGDKVDILVKREGKEKLFTATLRNTSGGTGIVNDRMSVLGAELSPVLDNEKEKLNIEYGLKVKKISKGKLQNAGIREGFIITSVNKKAVKTVDDIKDVLDMSRGGILFEGIYPNGEEAYYVFDAK